jgi:hypothetical protein
MRACSRQPGVPGVAVRRRRGGTAGISGATEQGPSCDPAAGRMVARF